MKDNGSELVSILKENGTIFLKKIEKDSKPKNLYDRFNNYRSTNYNSPVLGLGLKIWKRPIIRWI